MSFLVQTLCYVVFQALSPAGAAMTPAMVWPLGDTSGLSEVIKGHNAVRPGEVDQCFQFEAGPDDVPYRAIRQTGAVNSFVDIRFRQGDFRFRDMTLSVFVRPQGDPKGIIASYVSNTGHNLKIFVTSGLTFVSFWDEYGVSVGMTALPSLFQADTWTHLVIARQFSTGLIKIFRDGQLQQELDDDFPNEIALPTSGLMRLGGSADPDEQNEDGFKGAITCFQMYSAFPVNNDVSTLSSFCRPGKWKIKPEVLFDQRQQNGVAVSCQANMGKAGKPCDTVGIHCLTGGQAWRRLLSKNNWADSGRNAAYFHVQAKGFVPEGDDHLLGVVNATGSSICSRLCMRVQGCRAFALDEPGVTSEVQCVLYDAVEAANRQEPHSRYYVIKQ